MVPARVTLHTLRKKKQDGRRISMLTAYDYPTALVLDRAGVDVLLVGDSLSNVLLGHKTTLPVTMEQMLHHTAAVARGRTLAMLVADMPFLSYHATVADAVFNAGRFLKEAGADAVKLEGGREMADKVQAVIDAGIPVMGHLGLTPQSVSKLGGYRVQGRTAEAAERILEDARLLERAGIFSLVLECVPSVVATEVSRSLEIPVIGIGAGVGCDGQVLVIHDLVGLTAGGLAAGGLANGGSAVSTPRFVRRYAELGRLMEDAVRAYRADVESGAFPAAGESYEMDEGEEARFLKAKRGDT